MSAEFSIIASKDLFVSSVTRMKIPVVLFFDKTFTSDSQIVYHRRNYRLALFKMDHNYRIAEV